MKSFCELVEQTKQQMRFQAIQDIRQKIKETWAQEKINNYLKRFPNIIDKKMLEEKILTDDVVASFFCKDPSRQNISEKLAAELLSPLGFRKLPQTGKNSVRFDSQGKITASGLGATKAADFVFENNCYATQKYTMEDGGAQDNQRNDVIDFLEKGSLQGDVMAILDGEYWDKWRPNLKEYFCSNPNVKIVSVSELLEK